MLASTTLTDREADVMKALWDMGSGSVAEVRKHLADPLAHNTVLTMLGILEEKGFVRHEEEGRSHRYYPVVAERAAQKRAVRHLISKLFRGSSDLLLAHLVSDQKLSAAQIQRLRKLLKEIDPGESA
jgi:BlaI family transcriptional regulator, penicillinase repressor